MAKVMIRCPVTKKLVDTGIKYTDDASTLKPDTFQDIGTPCPYCGKTHTWESKDVILK